MKIFFVNTNKQWGGGEKWHFDTACAMVNKGHEVAILSYPGTELYKKSVSEHIITFPVRITNLSFLNLFKMRALAVFFKKEKPDILILNFSADIKTAGSAARLAGIKNIIYRRGNAKPIRNTFTNRYLYRKVITHIIANSEETRKAILKNHAGLFPSDRIKVIYNGIDVDRYDRQPVQNLYVRRGKEVILGSAGRLSPEKGQRYLVEMASELLRKKIEFKLLIAGEGPMEEELKRMVHEAGLHSHVIFTGFLKNIKDLMSSLDIFVLPSLWEGFGYVTVEAMACKKPVVAFRTGSNPEIIADHCTGFLVDNFNTAVLAEKVHLLIRDPALRQSFGEAGRKRVEEYFDLRISQNEIEKFLALLFRNTYTG